MGGELGGPWGEAHRFRPQRTRGVRGTEPTGLQVHGVQGGPGDGAHRFTSARRTRGSGGLPQVW